MRATCTAGGCLRDAVAKDLCAMHHRRFLRSGTAEPQQHHDGSRWDAIPPPGPWVQRGACRGHPLEVFFPTPPKGRTRYDDRRYVAAKAICAECPVLDECRSYSVPLSVLEGIWGGLTESGRQRARGRR